MVTIIQQAGDGDTILQYRQKCQTGNQHKMGIMPVKHTAEIIDVTEFVENEMLPLRTIPFPKDTAWKVRSEPINFETEHADDGPLAWSLVRTGDLIRIPLIPYRVPRDPPYTVLAAMDIMQRLSLGAPNALRTHIIVGSPLQDLSEEGVDMLRLWIGFAARIN